MCMTAIARKVPAALFFALALLSAPAAHADPMKCSGEEKTCLINCKKIARVAVSVCATGCGSRLSACMKTGCWDNGAQKYCGLMKS